MIVDKSHTSDSPKGSLDTSENPRPDLNSLLESIRVCAKKLIESSFVADIPRPLSSVDISTTTDISPSPSVVSSLAQPSSSASNESAVSLCPSNNVSLSVVSSCSTQELSTDFGHKSSASISSSSTGSLPESQSAFEKIIEFLRKERFNNVGELRSPRIKEYITINSRAMWRSFPEKYSFLKDLKALDEETLRNCKNFWGLINNRPFTLFQIIEKEEALVCLAWAKNLLDAKEPLVKAGIFSFLNFRQIENKYGNLGYFISFEVKPCRLGGNFVGCKIRQYSDVNVKSLNGKNKFEMLTFRVTDIKQDSIVLSKKVFDLLTEKEEILPRDKQSPRIKAELDKYESFLDERVAIFEEPKEFVYIKKLEAIERVRTNDLNQFTDPVAPVKPIVSHFNDSFKEILSALKDETGLNDCQAQALLSICTKSHGKGPFILNGLPGTGKTRSIGQFVYCVSKMDSNNRILLTAPSNRAADMLAFQILKFIDDKLLSSDEVLRLRSNSSDYIKRDKRLDPIFNIDNKEKVFEIPEDFRQYRIVICTLASSVHIVKSLTKKVNQTYDSKIRWEKDFFSHIFVDETEQATYSDLWLPLYCFASENTSLILCGDPKQLGPVNEFNFNYPIDSSLARYMENPIYKADPRVFCLLSKSYRCHTKILRISSELFYNNQLSAFNKNRDEPYHNWRGLPNKGFPILFVDVKNGIEKDREETPYSIANLEEVKAIVKLVAHLKTDFNLDPNDIGVIAPYKHQVAWVDSELKEAEIHGISVDSVERFQGSEKKIILVTTSRTKKLGFLRSPERLNTIITRARHLLIVVGKKKLLDLNDAWRGFIEYCDQNRSLIEWNGQVEYF